MDLIALPTAELARVVETALEEDLGPGDATSNGLFDADDTCRAALLLKQPGVVCGLAASEAVFRALDPEAGFEPLATDGDAVGETPVTVARVEGATRALLSGERTALNLLGRLSGIATLTRRFVVAAGPDLRVWDTRKTTPGLRSLQKAAVRAGGGVNHRGNLSDWVMFKDNHLTVLGIDEAVRSAKAAWPGRTVHVEADSIDQLRDALEAGADAVLLDNMSPDDVRSCVELATDFAASRGVQRALLEISGGITLENIHAYAGTGADVVSSGSLTNSAPILDIGLDIDVV